MDGGGDLAAGARPFRRLAVVNRGEPAMRLVNAVREWNAEGRPPLRTIAVHTAADRRAMFVREADEAVLIGPRATIGRGSDLRDPNPYLDLPELARALRACRAEAVWPGWGFVSENPEFAQLCRDLGLVFVGPTPEVMRALGDKIGSKLLAAEVGRADGALERRPGRRPRRGPPARRGDRLPAHGQGHGGRRRSRDPPRHPA